MKYQKLVDVYNQLEENSKRLEKTRILSDFIKELDDETLSKVGLLILGRVFPAWSDKELGIGSKLVMEAVAKAVGTTVDKVEDELREQGDIGLASVNLFSKKSQTTFFSQPLTIKFVFDNLIKLTTISGSKSTSRKISIILELLSQASATEAKYLTRTITEELRIGVGEGIVRDAIAEAFNIDKDIIDRAHMLTNDIAVVAKNEGEDGLKKLTLTPGKPVKPMLAQLSEGIEPSIKMMGLAICETKYDGIRLQVHRNKDEINIFTRRLENITEAMPEIVKAVDEYLPHVNYTVEGEVIATRDGKPLSFQNILHRVRRKYNIEEAIENVPLKLFLFDLLYFRKSMIDEPLLKRRKKLEEIVDTSSEEINLSKMVKGTIDNIHEVEELFKTSIEEGHEGIMKILKNLIFPVLEVRRCLNIKRNLKH